MSNEGMAAHWAAGADGWVAHEQRFDVLYAAATDRILQRADLGPGRRVLDIGCGTGSLLAAAVAAGAEAVGVDVSPTMVAAARRRVPRARVLSGDAQTVDLLDELGGPPFDRVVSRFGVMFFDDPVAAFRRIRSATADARLSFVCWRSLAENPTFTLGTQVLLDRLPELGHQPAGLPGPMAFADRDRLADLLTEAGWQHVEIEPLDFDCDYGRGGDGIEERLAIIFATTIGQKARTVLEPQLGPAGWAELLDEVRDQVRTHLRGGKVVHPAACWAVSARS